MLVLVLLLCAHLASLGVGNLCRSPSLAIAMKHDGKLERGEFSQKRSWRDEFDGEALAGEMPSAAQELLT